MAVSTWVVEELAIRAIIPDIAAEDTLLRKTSQTGGREYEAAGLGANMHWDATNLDIVESPTFDTIFASFYSGVSDGSVTVHPSTDNGSDSSSASFGGGGDIDVARGAYISAYGNEHDVLPGALLLHGGAVAGAYAGLGFETVAYSTYDRDTASIAHAATTHDFFGPVNTACIVTFSSDAGADNSDKWRIEAEDTAAAYGILNVATYASGDWATILSLRSGDGMYCAKTLGVQTAPSNWDYTDAAFGATCGTYLGHYNPFIGFNVYANSGNKFGAGSSGNYAADIYGDVINGGLKIRVSSSAGNATAACTLNDALAFTKNSIATFAATVTATGFNAGTGGYYLKGFSAADSWRLGYVDANSISMQFYNVGGVYQTVQTWNDSGNSVFAGTIQAAVSATILGNAAADAFLYLTADNATEDTDKWRLRAQDASPAESLLDIEWYGTGSWVSKLQINHSKSYVLSPLKLKTTESVLIGDGKYIGSTSAATALQLASTGIATFVASVIATGFDTKTGGYHLNGSGANSWALEYVDDTKIEMQFYNAGGVYEPVQTWNDSGDTIFAGSIFTSSMRSGATQAAAGAAAGELWRTASHATLPDNVVMRGA